jgi:hypothetical protein
VRLLLKGSWTFRSVALACVRGLSIVTLLALPCAAQEASSASTSYPVQGVVLDSVTHQPVARALVDAQGTAVLTDNDGHFEFNLPAGRALLVLRRPGYGNRGQASTHAIQVGADMPALTFSLVPEALITGQVTLSTADAADGIRITAYRRRVLNGRAQWVIQGTARTNSEGVFRLAGLEPGTYLLYTQPVRESNEPSQPGKTVEGYAAAYYPGVADASAAGLLTLNAGQHAVADFALTRQAFYSVTAAITNREGGEGTYLQVRDRSGREMGFPTRWNPQQGTVQTNVPNGSYILEARRGRASLYGRVEFTVAGAPVGGLNLPLLPMHGITVTVRKDFTAAANTASGGGLIQSNGGSLSAGVNVALVPAEEFADQGGSGGRMRPVPGASNGSSFEIEDVSPGRYWVETTPFQGYVSSITGGGVDLAREPLSVDVGSTSAPIEITLRNDTGTISGQLSGQAGTTGSAAVGEVRQAFIYAIPLYASSAPIAQAGAESSGQFTIPNLPPGSYRVVAFDALQEIDFHTAEGLAKYAGKGQTVTVEAGGAANAQLDLIQTGSGDPQE